jgi:predicted RNase H-like HicB family nuclease
MKTTKSRKRGKLSFNLTTVIEKAHEGGYIGFIEEIPGINTQGETLKEVQENIIDALLMALEYHREESEKTLTGKKKGFIRERFSFVAA